MNVDAGDYVLPVDKPVGPTSHDVVARARRALGTRRIGHTGTLDPFASGLLVLCIGRATRLAEYLTGLDKTYRAEARLGLETDTLDRDGDVTAHDDGWRGFTGECIAAALGTFRGTIEQVPPQFSAKKVAGEAMHRRARRGETVDLPPSVVTVHEIELEGVELPLVRFRLTCTSGTYVRAIARDLGRALGVGAHLTALRRTRVGSFDVSDALGLDALEDADAVTRARWAPAEALAHMGAVEVDAEAARRLGHGQRVRVDEPSATVGGRHDASVAPDGGAGDAVAVRHADRLIAIGRVRGGVLEPTKVFVS